MEIGKEANVEFIVITGSTDTDAELDSLTDIIRHALRTQFGCKKVSVTIEERFEIPEPETTGLCYH